MEVNDNISSPPPCPGVGDDSCCMEVMSRWMDEEGLKPATWATLIEILQDMNRTELSNDVYRSLHYRLDHS